MNKLSSWLKFQKLCAKQQYIFNYINTDSVINNGCESSTEHCNNDKELLSKNRAYTDVIQRTLTDEETIVKNKDRKCVNVKAQNQRRNNFKSDYRSDVPAEKTNEDHIRFGRIQKEGQKKTRLMKQVDPDSSVNTKRCRARVSRCVYCKTIFKTKEEQVFHRGSNTGCAFLCHKCPKEFQLKFSLR